MTNEKIHYLASDDGHKILQGSTALLSALQQFLSSPRPEEIIEGEFVGSGRYSSVCLVDGIALKVASQTSGEHYRTTGEPIEPEDLIKQYTFLRLLGNHLKQRRDNIVVPEQLFVVKSEYSTYLLGQEYMAGWVPVDTWARRHFRRQSTKEYLKFETSIKERLTRSVAGTALETGLNDLRYGQSGLHSGNLLRPADSKPHPSIPLCIIDQPGMPPDPSVVVT